MSTPNVSVVVSSRNRLDTLRVLVTSLEQQQLERLRGLRDVRLVPVDHAHTVALEVRQVMERVEDRVAVPAQVRRRAHPVEHERVRRPAVPGFELVGGRVEPYVRHAAALQLLEQRPEPVRVLVIDGDGVLGGRLHARVRS